MVNAGQVFTIAIHYPGRVETLPFSLSFAMKVRPCDSFLVRRRVEMMCVVAC